MLGIFLCSCWPFVNLPWRNVYLDLLSIFRFGCFFFIFILSCMSCLYILEIHLCQSHSLQRVSPVLKTVLFMVSFAAQKLVSLIMSCLCIFFFFLIFITLGAGSKKILLWFVLKNVLFSSKSFIVL